MEIKEFLKEIKLIHIPIKNCDDSIAAGQGLYANEFIEQLEKIKDDRDTYLLEVVLIMASKDGLSNRYTQVLCDLLLVNWHDYQEVIANNLEEIRDPESIESLYKRAIDIPANDDLRALARKCIRALWAIHTREAIAKIVLLGKSEDKYTREFAQWMLSHEV